MKKELTSYVPVTMDELMVRFVLNMKRNEYKEAFDCSKAILERQDIRNETEEKITEGVEGSLGNLQNMMF